MRKSGRSALPQFWQGDAAAPTKLASPPFVPFVLRYLRMVAVRKRLTPNEKPL